MAHKEFKQSKLMNKIGHKSPAGCSASVTNVLFRPLIRLQWLLLFRRHVKICFLWHSSRPRRKLNWAILLKIMSQNARSEDALLVPYILSKSSLKIVCNGHLCSGETSKICFLWLSLTHRNNFKRDNSLPNYVTRSRQAPLLVRQLLFKCNWKMACNGRPCIPENRQKLYCIVLY